MNRSVALFVALALLVAHALAIHTTASGDLAPPYDMAFAAFRVGRTFVHEGVLAWSPSAGGLDSYPSALWVLFSYLMERSFLSINDWAQLTCGGCALMTVLLTSRFHSDRVESLVAPFLLAVSGSFAAAALSGTETALVTLLFTASFVAFQRGWSRTFGITLALCGLARSEAWVLPILYLIQRFLPGLGGGGDRKPHLSAFLLPLVAFLSLALLRISLGGEFTASFKPNFMNSEASSFAEVGASLRDLLVSGVSPALLVYTFWYLFRRRLSTTGRQALFLGCSWAILSAFFGDEALPFNASMVPALPILFIAVQEGLINALNSSRPWVRQLSWGSIMIAGLLTILVSRAPANFGPLPLARVQYTYLKPSQEPRLGSYGWLGRPGLVEEIEKTQFLRATGLFFRDNVDPSATILTPWPGSVGYLTRMDVRDLFGRATQLPGEDRLRPWRNPGRSDLLKTLSMDADYLIPTCRPTPNAPSPEELAKNWSKRLEESSASETQRLFNLVQALEAYELITIPLPSPAQPTGKRSHGKAYILRRKDLNLAPKLELELRDGVIHVYGSSSGHLQLAGLSLSLNDSEGRSSTISPSGSISDHPVLARMELLLIPTGDRKMELMRLKIPEQQWSGTTLHATLVNPGARQQHAFVRVSETQTLKIP